MKAPNHHVLTLWYPAARDESVREDLAREVAEFAAVDADPTSCDILIEGRPTVEQLPRIRQGGAVIVPFAGVPPATVEALQTRPDLTLHNLHHNSAETAETALALLLAVARRIVRGDTYLRRGDWTPRYTPEECIRLEGKSAAVLGLGAIGRRVAAGCLSLGMKVTGIRRQASGPSEFAVGNTLFLVPTKGIDSLHEVLVQANVLLLCLPQTDDTIGLIGKPELELLQAPAILINIARAQIVEERALYESLQSGRLHGAGLDVWYRYPKHPEGIVPGYFQMPEEARHTFPSEYPFHELETIAMSPHRGGSSIDSERLRVEHLSRLIELFYRDGEMPNRVNLSQGY